MRRRRHCDHLQRALTQRARVGVCACVRAGALFTRSFPRFRYRSHIRGTFTILPAHSTPSYVFCNYIARGKQKWTYYFSSCAIVKSCRFHSNSRPSTRLLIHASQIPSQSCRSLLPLVRPSFFRSQTLKFLKLHSVVPIKWRQVEWKYKIDYKQEQTMVFRQGTLSDTTRMRRCLTRTNALAVIASHVRILCRNGMSERDQRGFAPLLNGGKNPPPAHTRQMDGLTPLSHRVPTFLSALSIFLWTVSVVGLSVSFFYVRSLF